MCICIENGCNQTAGYGNVNTDTGMFEKKHCKIHKNDDEKGHPPNWCKRFVDFTKIVYLRNYILLTTEEEWVECTKKQGTKFKPRMECNKGHLVENTTISHFVNGNRSCPICSGNKPWSERYTEFLNICKERGFELLINSNEWKGCTKKNGADFKPKMKCENGHIVENTTIGHFVNSKIGCSTCSGKQPWSERYTEFLDICKERNFELLINYKEWISGTKGKKKWDFKPKMMCENGHLVENTTIGHFVNSKIGCSTCSGKQPWSERYTEFLNICKERDFELVTTEGEWITGTKAKKGGDFKPILKCNLGHSTNISIDSFINSKNGCKICSQNQPWSERYTEFLEICKERGFELVTTEGEWINGTKKKGKYFKPRMECNKGHLLGNTSVGSFVNNSIGCTICSKKQPWSKRYIEFINICNERGYKLLTTQQEWIEYANKYGQNFKPMIKCPKGHKVVNTTIDRFVNGNNGCPRCVNKTEEKFNKHLQESQEKLKIKQIRIHYKPKWANQKQTHNTYYEYDFTIELINGVKIIIEIDGIQHYTQVSNWKNPILTQIRDKIKERLALRNNFSVLRVNQEDIYNDKNNWQYKLENYICKKLKSEAKPDITDYTDSKRYLK